MNGQLRVFGLIVAIGKYGPDAELGDIPGTQEDALAFHRWLVDVRGAKPDDIVTCTSPNLPAGVEATRDTIRTEVRKMAAVAAQVEADLFVMYSGHGARVDGEDILIPADYRARDGDKCIRLSQLQSELWQAMGPGAHYWFINCCRAQAKLEVPQFALGLPPSPRGMGDYPPNSLFAAAGGESAPVHSPFYATVIEGLKGSSRAKRWLDDGYWVVFSGLAELVKAVCSKVGMEIRLRSGSIGKILELPPPVPDIGIVVTVHGAQPDDTFTLSFSGNRYGVVRRIDGPRAEVTVPPGDWWPTLEGPGVELRYPGPLEAYDPVEIEFDVSSPAHANLPRPGLTLVAEVPDSADLKYQVSQAGRPFGDVDLSVGAALDPGGGPVALRLVDRDEPVHTVVVDPTGMDGPIGYDQLRPNNLLLDNLLPTINRSYPPWLGDLLAGSTPDAAIADPDPASLLALLGGAAISGQAPYSPPVRPLSQFESLSPTESAIYILTTHPVDGGTVASRPAKISFTNVAELGPDVWQVGHQVEPGHHRIRVRVADRELELPVVAIPGHVTMVVLDSETPASAPDADLRLLQFALPPGHLVDAATTTQHDAVLSAIRFGALVQRRFAAGRPAMATTPHQKHLDLWRELRSGRWPDPITMLVAAYELLRRGAIAHDPTPLVGLLESLEERFGQYRPADLDVLWALVDGATPVVDEVPLVLDGAMASGILTENGPARMALDYTGLWTRWRTWSSQSANPQAQSEVVTSSPILTANYQRSPCAKTFDDGIGQVASARARANLRRMSRMDRQAHDRHDRRQPFVDALCAYLRSPRRALLRKGQRMTGENTPVKSQEAADDVVVQELVQATLRDHLRPGSLFYYWPQITLDLSGAELVELDLSGCNIVNASFDRANFTSARFEGTRFITASFYAAVFMGEANFRGAEINDATFTRANFGANARFDNARFSQSALFDGVQFQYGCHFDGARFVDHVRFDRAQFHGAAVFADAQFHGAAAFTDARFADHAGKAPEVVEGEAWVRLDVPAELVRARTWPPGLSVESTYDSPEPGVPGSWGQLVGPTAGAEAEMTSTVSVY